MTDEQKEIITQLYYSMYDTLFLYAQLHAKNLAPPEDIVHDAFSIACTRLEELLRSENQKGWIMLTMKNVIRTLNAKQISANKTITALSSQTDDDMIAKEDTIKLRLLYGDLVDTEDFKLVWEQICGYSIQELAEQRGISENACKNRLVRAKKALRKKIEKK